MEIIVLAHYFRHIQYYQRERGVPTLISSLWNFISMKTHDAHNNTKIDILQIHSLIISGGIFYKSKGCLYLGGCFRTVLRIVAFITNHVQSILRAPTRTKYFQVPGIASSVFGSSLIRGKWCNVIWFEAWNEMWSHFLCYISLRCRINPKSVGHSICNSVKTAVIWIWLIRDVSKL